MSETFAFENLIAGSQKAIVQRPGTVALGQAFSRGQLMGLLTSTLKWQSVAFSGIASFSDFGVAVEAIDTTAGEENTTFYVEGEFNEAQLSLDYSDTADEWRETLAGHGIYIRKAVNTAGV
jgi:hypothetical protein